MTKKKHSTTEAPTFNLGDTVTWTSQAGGHSLRKTGTVVEVVRPGSRCGTMGGMSTRNHQSYAVRVEFKARRSRSDGTKVVQKKPQLYWPVVSLLKLVKVGANGHDLDITPHEVTNQPDAQAHADVDHTAAEWDAQHDSSPPAVTN